MIINFTLNLKHIILITIGLLILKYIYDNYKKKIIEKADNTPKIDQTMLDAINKVYKADIEAIRNLSSYATYLMSGDAKGSGVTVPASLTATTSLTSPIVNTDILTSQLSLNTTDINATTLNLGKAGKTTKTTITEDQLFDLLNTQTDHGCGNCECDWGDRDVIFITPFRKVPIVYITISGCSTGSGNWESHHVWVTKVSTTGFTYHGNSHGHTTIRWVAMACNYTWFNPNITAEENRKRGCA
jgi:hypothetical protein